MSNRCYNPKAPEEGPPLIQNGTFVFQAHDVGWVVASFFTIVSCVTSFWLINKHLIWYTNKKEQRYIVRILFMVPIYSIVSLLSYFFWNNSTPLLLLRDCYESFVLTAFFYLLLVYLSPNPDVQRSIFRKQGYSKENDAEMIRKGEPIRKWVFPLGFIKWKPQDGLYFLQVMKWGVLQYCVLRPLTTFFAVLLNYVGLYCESSWSPAWGHVYITAIVSLSVTIAMYCLLSMYISVSSELSDKRPVLKLISIKAVVFLTFWQASFLSALSMFGVVKDTAYMTAEDINIGWGALLETFEMVIFGFVHIKAFSYKPYCPIIHDADTPRTPRLRSLAHAMNFKETFRELRDGWVYLWQRMRGKEVKSDRNARRDAWYEGAFGKERPMPAADWEDPGRRGWDDKDIYSGGLENDGYGYGNGDIGRGLGVDSDVVVTVEGERQWLGAGDEYGYGIGFESRGRAGRERSEALGTQIEAEFSKRGYELTTRDEPLVEQGHIRGGKSWWRSIYERVSHQDPEPTEKLPPAHRRQTPRAPRRDLDVVDEGREFGERRVLMGQYEYDDAPPPSIIRTYRSKRSRLSLDVPHTPPRQDQTLRPTHDVYPRQAPAPTPDSMLLRVFPSDAGHSSTTTPSTMPSSQSHRTRVNLGPTPIIVTKGGDISHVPKLVTSPTSLHRRDGEDGDRRVSRQKSREDNVNKTARVSSSRSQSRHRSHNAQPDVVPPLPPLSLNTRARPTPVMPAPLSPASGSSSPHITPPPSFPVPISSPDTAQPSSPTTLRRYSGSVSAYPRPSYIRQPTTPPAAKERRRSRDIHNAGVSVGQPSNRSPPRFLSYNPGPGSPLSPQMQSPVAAFTSSPDGGRYWDANDGRAAVEGTSPNGRM